ncbi:hypothetical protein A3C09_03720 [Candidatus Uhrbacteria bacterium RIFCSPHIGHO2_02_FULL_47_44]|uniref:Uncharacterized protein n=1 Tax=Candidatus Uhrbacteria bacterium RIFCSPLOWO2_02_FULL_48_18 TaxID=1802408 RepID=A0A1F7V6X3_9BACT|nr:MAG: hypothetical protein A2839_05440 [Candidatus Uhrbacteria bacterium RIFCSPHIGHO2_01_FULL_47_10]OGL71315.1 MAG: hypothetical protein A3C09_03720 [Candidatus Uhrbacteria bacterium RIFCSPHIGHO2_02_FULL_47_44]OGL77603.1 MAG: hypothetical protein A3E97_04985 [Candidatus Uhrbacteria bacterium RIFCSPHIGHO2_12_FULL_47_12]OGL80409.1 MAG: hypothetical protein A3B20_03270 [Candidatus Uhrbacteria bacterium RIFCSPLOWO2_01_FULL_47_17]OGL86269.1 MAG: hypothetical protein A3I41_01755 [Candidatus Uhrbact
MARLLKGKQHVFGVEEAYRGDDQYKPNLVLCVDKKMHIQEDEYGSPYISACDGSCEPKDLEIDLDEPDEYGKKNQLARAVDHFLETGHACGFSRKGGFIDAVTDLDAEWDE